MPEPLTKDTPAKSTVDKAKRRKVCELTGSEIRWFYKDDAVDTTWLPFKGYDSLVLEYAYRRRHNIPMDMEMIKWEKELVVAGGIVLDGIYQINDAMDEVAPIYWPAKSCSLRITRGSWFETDYMQPLVMDLADAIEENHLLSFRGQLIPDAPVFSDSEASKKPVLTYIKWSDSEEVCWNSVIDVTITNSKKGNRIFRFVTRASNKTTLRRGYTKEAIFEEGRPNFSDLILVVHGVGQKKYENLVVKNTAQIRNAMVDLMEKHYAEEKKHPMILPIEWRSSLELDKGTTEQITLPRMSNIREHLNSVAMDIIYYQSPLYRTEIVNGVAKHLNSTYALFMKNNPGFAGPVSILAHSLGSVVVYDILTHWSPYCLYDAYISKAVSNYREKADPSEAECHLLDAFEESRSSVIKVPGLMEKILIGDDARLQFKVKNLFCIGSPLAVFIINRGGTHLNAIPPTEQLERIYNIFHPCDPIAYRLEPLFHEKYRHVRPLKVFDHHDARKSYEEEGYTLHRSYRKKLKKEKAEDKALEESETAKNSKEGKKRGKKHEKDADGGNDSDSDNSSIRSGATSPRSTSPEYALQPATKEEQDDGVEEAMEVMMEDLEQKLTTGEEASTSPEKSTQIPGEAGELIEEIPPDRRLKTRYDYQIAPTLAEKSSSYYGAYRGHFTYWNNSDVSAFVLNALYDQPNNDGGKDSPSSM